MNNSLTILIRNEISEISRILDLIERFGEENNISPGIINSLNLSLDEIITNTISYGYKDSESHTICVALELKNNVINVKIEDDGIAFNPLEVPEADITKPLEEKSIGGLGVHLVKNLMDSVAYRRIENKNIFIMNKNINKEL